MDLPRKVGIGIVSMIPAFVLGGLVWGWFGSWMAVLGMVALVAMCSGFIISGKLSTQKS